MSSKYFKIILRNFLRRPLYPLLNILCLSIGFFTVFNVSSWLQHELSYDDYHENATDIYRLSIEVNNPEMGYHTHFARSWFQWLNEIDDNIAGIDNLARISRRGSIVSLDQKTFKADMFFADPSCFDLFDINYITPPSTLPLSEPYTMILTRSASVKYFGNENPVGRSMEVYCSRCTEKKDYRVVAVIEDPPSNTHFKYEILASYEDPENTGWAYYYLRLNDNVSPDEILENFGSFAANYADENYLETLSPHLQNIRDIHLKSHKDRELEENGNMRNIWLFSLLALSVFFLALFNFMNLQYVGLIKRFQTLKLMKIVGASSKSLTYFQFIEVFLFSFFALLISMILFLLLRPLFTLMIFGEADLFLSPESILFFILTSGILIILTLFTGMYPWILNSLKIFFRNKKIITGGVPAKILYGKNKMFTAKVLVTFQYAATFIILLLMFYSGRQVEFMMQNRLGGKNSEVLVINDLPVQVIDKYEVFKETVLKNPLIYDVTSSFEAPADENMDTMPFEADGASPEIEEKHLYVYPVDDNYFRFYDLDLIAGTDFPEYYGNDSLNENYILNESALRFLGWKAQEVPGKDFSLIFNYGDRNLFNGGKIVGVVEDFQPSSLKNEIKPYVFFQKSFWLFSAQVRYDTARTGEVLDVVKQSWEEIYPGFPFEYTFIEDLYEEVYKNEIRLKNLGKILGIIALVLSCLGLWALTGIIYQQRTKETGIRRVNGARIYQIVWLLTKEVFFMMIIALFAGFPVAWYLLVNWLNNFPYRVELSFISFWVIGLLLIIISLITAGYHAVKTSFQNPVDSLRYE